MQALVASAREFQQSSVAAELQVAEHVHTSRELPASYFFAMVL
jgi:hypothetical protein